MRISESPLREMIRMLIRESKSDTDRSGVFLRWGDPRDVRSGRSIIHDPDADSYEDEPALWMGSGDDAPPRHQTEAGISAYPVIDAGPGGITFRIGLPIDGFRSQLSGFLLDRVIGGSVWRFRGVPLQGAQGTDGEPLIDAASVRDVQHIPDVPLRAVDPDGHSADVVDLIDRLSLWGVLNTGYDEFFGRKPTAISRSEIDHLFADLRRRLTTPRLDDVLDRAHAMWLEQWEEDHPGR